MTKNVYQGGTKLERLKKQNREMDQTLRRAMQIIVVLINRSLVQPVRIYEEDLKAVEGYQLNRSNGQDFMQLSVTPPSSSPIEPTGKPSDEDIELAREALNQEQLKELDQVP